MTATASDSLNIREILGAPFTLPCGVTLPNRIIKAAMTEQLADARFQPTEELIRLYERWGQGGTAVHLTGNVMVDRRSLEGPRNVAVEDERDLPQLRTWAERAQANGAQLWMQISHPGRQTPSRVSSEIVAPSVVPLKGYGPLFRAPRALDAGEIEPLIERFVTTAAIAREAGFGGVQIHSAHGYLLSQFLSPRTNLRTDEWGGSLENRMRFLLETVRRTRQAVGSGYPISVKLNSADFQRGGFSEEESMLVVHALEREGVDLLEISGGNYENPMMIQRGEVAGSGRESTRLREAFYLAYAEKVRAQTPMPLMLTGGLRTAATMASIVAQNKVDFVGLARPLAIDPDFSRKLLDGTLSSALPVNVRLGVRQLDDMLQSMWYQQQMLRMGKGLEPDLKVSRLVSLCKGLYNVLGARSGRAD
ncbi:MAG: NADH:flavin oxidoreductase/NADH oxidase family protein [Candidatus Hydrogenedentes bacterium]|nr:NADH:flavin oxidoreductase/NADH oxidase family protein [Candidatus Hydrogenedentota bacterium]